MAKVRINFSTANGQYARSHSSRLFEDSFFVPDNGSIKVVSNTGTIIAYFSASLCPFATYVD